MNFDEGERVLVQVSLEVSHSQATPTKSVGLDARLQTDAKCFHEHNRREKKVTLIVSYRV